MILLYKRKMNFSVSKFCLPAQIYLALLVLSLIIALFQRFSITIVLVKLFFGLIWTWILNFICSKGYEAISWVLVLFPFILLFLVLLISLEMVGRNNTVVIVDDTKPVHHSEPTTVPQVKPSTVNVMSYH